MAKLQIPSRESAFVLVAGAVSEAAATAAERIGLAEKVRELGRRVRRAGLLFTLLMSALIVMSLTAASIPLLLWLILIPVAAFASMLSLMWPASRRSRIGSPRPDLSRLARRTRLQLARSCRSLPRGTRELADSITAQLGKIETGAADCRLDPLAEIEARRLLSDDLPRLLSSYSRLPAAERQASETVASDLHVALSAISRELESLCGKIDQRNVDMFDTQRRFIAGKYPEPVLDTR